MFIMFFKAVSPEHPLPEGKSLEQLHLLVDRATVYIVLNLDINCSY